MEREIEELRHQRDQAQSQVDELRRKLDDEQVCCPFPSHQWKLLVIILLTREGVGLVYLDRFVWFIGSIWSKSEI